jgi:hypothetical protein
MSEPPFLPEARAYRLRNARVPGAFLTGGVPAGAILDGEGCALLDIVVADGVVSAVGKGGKGWRERNDLRRTRSVRNALALELGLDPGRQEVGGPVERGAPRFPRKVELCPSRRSFPRPAPTACATRACPEPS